MSLKSDIKAEARRLGFHLGGVTTPDPPPHFDIFAAWLQAGRHAEMAYLDSDRSLERRADPREILPECRSILVLAIPYPAPPSLDRHTGHDHSPPGGESPRGRVAAYAWGDDYHLLLPGRLRSLVDFIESRVGHPVPNRWYTDTGPILERDLAQRAGLGWIGKNTLLIHPGQGSYFLLAEILLGLELEPDLPFVTDHCGSCTRCLDACPTQCILPDRTIDAGRCISYLTIELKGPIPAEIRPQLGEWVFGCDVCQQVCPWNERFANQDVDGRLQEPAFSPRPDVPRPDLLREIALSPADFNRKFKDSPLKRARRRGYLRNVAVVLGNSGHPQAVPTLRRALLADPEPLVRAHAAWALGRIGGDEARRALEEAAGRGRQQPGEEDPSVRVEIEAALTALASSPPSAPVQSGASPDTAHQSTSAGKPVSPGPPAP
jgi:epoxyqueuosine reductase